MSITLPITEKLYQVYKKLTVLNTKVTKLYRYGLGLNTEESILEPIKLIAMAKNAPKSHKSTYLLKAQAELETLALKLRLYLELNLANETQIFQLQADLQEVGRMMGGWLKSLA